MKNETIFWEINTQTKNDQNRASKSGINVQDPISGPKCPDNIFGKKGPINIINNEPYSVYMLYYDKLLSILMDLVHISSELGKKLGHLCLSS